MKRKTTQQFIEDAYCKHGDKCGIKDYKRKECIDSKEDGEE